MARQRNNITRLPMPVRARISELLDDGATYDEIRNDGAVAQALEAGGGIQLNSTTFAAYRESAEYQEFCRSRRRWGDEIERRRMAAHVVGADRSADDLARIANYELLRLVLRKLEAGEELEPGELRSVSGALAAYERNRISEAREDARRESDEKESQYRTRIADLERLVAGLETQNERLKQVAGEVDSGRVADAMKERFGV